MRAIGIKLWAVGAAISAYALFFYDPSGGSGIVNLDLQQRQMMIMLLGLAALMGGVVVHAMSYLQPKIDIAPPHDEQREVASELERQFGSLPLPDSSISDAEIAQQEADSRAFSATKSSL